MNEKANGEEKITLTQLNIPVKIFFLFLAHNKKEFTVAEIQLEFNALYKVELKPDRVKQILDDLCLSGNLSKEQKPSGTKNKLTWYYTYKTLM